MSDQFHFITGEDDSPETIVELAAELDRIIRDSNGATLVIDFSNSWQQVVRITTSHAVTTGGRHPKIKSGIGHNLAVAVSDYLDRSDNS